MKKLLIFAAATTIAFSGMAQDNHKGKGHHNDKSEKNNKHRDDDYDNDHDDNNRSRSKKNTGVYNDGQDGKYSKNIPSKVNAAFYRDYPGASNVSWTKNNGYWIASFPNGLYRTTATYSANGQRINGATSKTTQRRRTTSTSEDGSIWDKILTKQ